MRSTAVALTTCLALAGLATATVVRPPTLSPVTARSAESSVPGMEVTWSELATTPCRFHDQLVRFDIQFHGRPQRWHAGATRFGPGAFAAISAWSDEQFPWIEEEFEQPVVRLFVRLDSAADRTLQSAFPHQRFAVEGIVRDVWRDRPWIELTNAVALPDSIGEATVFHAARAIERMEEASFEIADESLQQALSAPLPDKARLELERLRAVCAERSAEPQHIPIRPRRK